MFASAIGIYQSALLRWQTCIIYYATLAAEHSTIVRRLALQGLVHNVRGFSPRSFPLLPLCRVHYTIVHTVVVSASVLMCLPLLGVKAVSLFRNSVPGLHKWAAIQRRWSWLRLLVRYPSPKPPSCAPYASADGLSPGCEQIPVAH